MVRDYQTEKTAYQLCAAGQSALDGGDVKQARELLLRASALDPTSYSTTIHINLARSFAATKNQIAAADEYKKALSFEPSRDDLLYEIASCYFACDRFDHASEYLKKYISVVRDPSSKAQAQTFLKDIGTYGNLKKGTDLIAKKKFSQARKFLEAAAALDPSQYSASIHGNLCFVLQQLGEYSKAIAEGKTALKLDPDDRQTMYNLGMTYSDMCEFDEAISWITRYASLEQDPGRRAQAMDCIKGFQDDRTQYRDAANKQADYLDFLKANNDVEKWPKERLPLRIFIKPGQGVLGYRASFPNYIKLALDTWCTASGKKLNYVLVNNSGKADITVEWTSKPIDFSIDHANVAVGGLTHVNSDDSKRIESAAIQVRTVDPFNPKEPIDDGECAHLCMHEVGHALGLGHSRLIKDVMYFRSANQQAGPPTARDRATLARLYQDYPAIAFQPQAAINAAEPVKYSPPPAFLPPAAPDDGNLTPPLFMPPPLHKEEALQPPLFTPPPLERPAKEPAVPTFFTPPPKQ